MKMYLLLIDDADRPGKILNGFRERENAQAARKAAHRAHWAYHEPQWAQTGYMRSWEDHWRMAQAENWSPRIEEIEIADDQERLPEMLDFLGQADTLRAVASVVERTTARWSREPAEAEAEASDIASAVLHTIRSSVLDRS